MSLEITWCDDLHDLEILRVLDFPVANVPGLEYTISFPDDMDTLSFVLESGPTVQHVDHLKRTVVPVPLPGGVVAFEGPDDVGDVSPLGGILDTQIPVLEI